MEAPTSPIVVAAIVCRRTSAPLFKASLFKCVRSSCLMERHISSDSSSVEHENKTLFNAPTDVPEIPVILLMRPVLSSHLQTPISNAPFAPPPERINPYYFSEIFLSIFCLLLVPVTDRTRIPVYTEFVELITVEFMQL